MTFSEYAQMLNPYLSAGMLPDKFIISLTTQIMDESFFNENTPIEEHPFGNKDEDTLRRIYKGTKSLARKDAQIILNHLDKVRFQDYLSKIPSDVLDLIREDMLQCEITIDDNEIDTCTDLFVSILKDCAGRKLKSKSKSTLPPYEQEPPACVDDGDATPVSDKSGDTSPNTEVAVTLDETISSGTERTGPRSDSGGAQLSIPDKYRRCAFCIDWTGDASDAYKSKTGVRGICKLYNRVQRSTDGIDCKDYEPNEARISKQILLSQ